jgi:hypothetical protein
MSASVRNSCAPLPTGFRFPRAPVALEQSVKPTRISVKMPPGAAEIHKRIGQGPLVGCADHSRNLIGLLVVKVICSGQSHREAKTFEPVIDQTQKVRIPLVNILASPDAGS